MITNTQECFVRLWLRLERTRRLLAGQYKRFCIRHILKEWFSDDVTDGFICVACRTAAPIDFVPASWHQSPKYWPMKKMAPVDCSLMT